MSSYWLLLVFLLLIGAVTLDLMLRRQARQERNRRFEEIWSGQEEARWLVSAIADQKRQRSVLGKLPQDESVALNLRRLGWNHPRAETLYSAIALLTPLCGLAAGALSGLGPDYDPGETLSLAFLGGGIGYLLPPRVLRHFARRRQKAIGNEMLATLHLLRMLFDAGLSLEHALRIISEQGRGLAPNLANEIALALTRINAGQDRADALEEMAAPLAVPELDDTVAILKQATRYGGSLRDSLSRLIVLIEDRQLTTMREYVSKLSAKMTMVMVIFMFPALMFFLAGPGFISLAKALKAI